MKLVKALMVLVARNITMRKMRKLNVAIINKKAAKIAAVPTTGGSLRHGWLRLLSSYSEYLIRLG